MGLIRVLDYVDRCYNGADGQVIHDLIEQRLTENEQLVISFDGVDSIPSSFVNTALISFLDVYDFEQIKKRLRFSNTTKEINEMIKSRFMFEANRIVKTVG